MGNKVYKRKKKKNQIRRGSTMTMRKKRKFLQKRKRKKRVNGIKKCRMLILEKQTMEKRRENPRDRIRCQSIKLNAILQFINFASAITLSYIYIRIYILLYFSFCVGFIYICLSI